MAKTRWIAVGESFFSESEAPTYPPTSAASAKGSAVIKVYVPLEPVGGQESHRGQDQDEGRVHRCYRFRSCPSKKEHQRPQEHSPSDSQETGEESDNKARGRATADSRAGAG